jgi:hypothetical protein
MHETIFSYGPQPDLSLPITTASGLPCRSAPAKRRHPSFPASRRRWPVLTKSFAASAVGPRVLLYFRTTFQKVVDGESQAMAIVATKGGVPLEASPSAGAGSKPPHGDSTGFFAAVPG